MQQTEWGVPEVDSRGLTPAVLCQLLIVDDEKTVILVAPENSLKMANAILKIFRKGEWREAKYEKVKNVFDVHDMTKKYGQIYTELD